MLPEVQRDSIERHFKALKGMNELDEREIKRALSAIVEPTTREAAFILNYRRAHLNVQSLLAFTNAKDYQVIAMIARTCLELAVELKLIANDPDAGEKVLLFMEVEKLKFARRVDKFRAQHPNATLLSGNADTQFIVTNEARLSAEKDRVWPNVRNLKHWSRMSMEERARKLGGGFHELYQLHYSQMSWYVHPGLTGVAGIKDESFSLICGLGLIIALDSYRLILDTTIDFLKLSTVDPMLRNKVQFACELPFAPPEKQDDLRVSLLGA